MNQNFLIEMMYFWGVANCIACLLLALFCSEMSLKKRVLRERMLKFSLLLNISVVAFLCDGKMSPLPLWGLMIFNVIILVFCLEVADYRYEKWLQTRLFDFRPVRVKHQMEYGEVNIDGKTYCAFIPPMRMDEFGVEDDGQNDKSSDLEKEKKVRFRRFVYGYGGKTMVELG